MLSTLTLNVKREYFEAIRDGTKLDEYRLATPYWGKRLEGRQYDSVCICLGYPKKGDESRRLRFPYRGYKKKTITHKHFGAEPVEVYAIKLENKQ